MAQGWPEAAQGLLRLFILRSRVVRRFGGTIGDISFYEYFGGMPKATTSQANRPFHEIRHRSIRATIWKDDTAKGPMYNVTVSRAFKDADQWKDSHSFAFDDLMNVAKALYDAHSFISAQLARDRQANSGASRTQRSAR
jgi:hypothetical protein